jgi:uncharacterized membrane protein
MPLPPTEYVSQLRRNSRPIFIWLTVAAITLFATALLVAAPLAQTAGYRSLALGIYGSYSHLCHQIPERSFFVAGYPFAVCARCTGLYAGFTLATLCFPLVRSLRATASPARRWLFLAAAPLAFDFLLGYFGIWENTHLSRLLTGALLGSVAVFYVMPGLLDISFKEWRKLFSRTPAEIR